MLESSERGPDNDLGDEVHTIPDVTRAQFETFLDFFYEGYAPQLITLSQPR